VGKDDPVMIVRCQSGFPAVGEVLEPFAFPRLRELRVVDPGIKDLDAIQKTVAREAAYYLEEIARPGASIGISGGKTLYYMITYLEPERLTGLHLYPLTLTGILTLPGLTANALVGMMSTRYPDATAFNLPTMPGSSREDYEKQMAANPELLKTYREIWEVEIMVLGVGYLTGQLPGFRALAQQELKLSAEELKAKGMVGEINHIPIDAQGEPMLNKDPDLAKLTRRVIGVGPFELRERAARADRYVVAVAGGLEKAEAIRACLKGRYFNVLITDAYAAEVLTQG
jgi:DNA-binding transcriptional regulator LsrR (DeoR family)